MKTLRLVLALLISLATVLPAVAQDDGMDVGHFKAWLRTGRCVEGRHGLLTSTRLSGVSLSGQSIDVDRSELSSLSRQKGSRAGKAAALGAGLGLLTFIAAYANVEADPNSEVNDDAVAPVAAACIGGGALLGALLGAGSKSWEQVPLGSQPAPSPRAEGGLMSHGPRGLVVGVRFAY